MVEDDEDMGVPEADNKISQKGELLSLDFSNLLFYPSRPLSSSLSLLSLCLLRSFSLRSYIQHEIVGTVEDMKPAWLEVCRAGTEPEYVKCPTPPVIEP